MFGDGPTTVLFLPTWQLVYSRTWKMQVPYLARHYRVIAFDPRGNGRSARPADAAAYTVRAMVDDARDVLDATQTRTAIVVGYSSGGVVLAMLAAYHPERVDGAVFIAPVSPLGTPSPPSQNPWSEHLATSDSWAKHNKSQFTGVPADFSLATVRQARMARISSTDEDTELDPSRAIERIRNSPVIASFHDSDRELLALVTRDPLHPDWLDAPIFDSDRLRQSS